MSYGAALALTVAIESPMYALALWRFTDCRPADGALRGLAVNLVSHPLAIALTLPALGVLVGYWSAVVAVEVGVCVLEAALLRISLPDIGFERLAQVSLACNVASLSAGLALLA
jgi:uncharacterized membrane protein YkgB